MRIAYLTQSYPPMISGAAIFAQKAAQAMAQRGHQVLVIAASDRERSYQTYAENLTVVRLRSFNNPFRIGQRLLSHPGCAVMKLLKQFKPDVIHTHEPLQLGMLALYYANRSRIPVIITAHQLPWFVASYLPQILKPVAEKFLWSFARVILKRYTSIVAPTQTIAGIIKDMTGLKPDVISYGLDLQTFHPPLSSDPGPASRARLGLPLNVPIILHVGRLDTDKSVDQVIRSAATAIRESEAHLLVVGDGCQKNFLIHLCRELGIEQRVRFTGFIHPSNLPEVYRMADIFVTASEIETQGIVLLEAAASGLPIVAVNATCIPEAVHDRVNGFLIESGNIHMFSDTLVSLLNDPKRACTMGTNGRILAERHGIQNTWILYESLYQEISRQFYKQGTAKPQSRLEQWRFVKALIGLK